MARKKDALCVLLCVVSVWSHWSPGRACHAGFTNMNSVTVTGGAQVLVAENGRGSLWGSFGAYFEHLFLVSEEKMCAI